MINGPIELSDYVEKHNPKVLEDINLGLVSPSEGFTLVKSEIEDKDMDTVYTVRNIEARIKRLSSIVSKKEWEEMLDRIYG